MLDDLAWHLDEPFGDPSAIPTYMVSKLAAEHVNVVLSGDGGDELFAGYDRYRVEERERRRERVPAALRHALGTPGRPMPPKGCEGRNFLRHWLWTAASAISMPSTLLPARRAAGLLQPDVFAGWRGGRTLAETWPSTLPTATATGSRRCSAWTSRHTFPSTS